MATVNAQADTAPIDPAVQVVASTMLPSVQLFQSDASAVSSPMSIATRWATIVMGPVVGIIQFWKDVFSPGLNDVPPLSCLKIRNGGQHRY